MSRRKASKVSSLARKKAKAARRGEGGTHSGAPRKRTRRLLEAGGMLSHTIPPSAVWISWIGPDGIWRQANIQRDSEIERWLMARLEALFAVMTMAPA